MSRESIVDTRKNFKRNKVLGLIRSHENCSRYEIKKLTSYSMATVLSIIENLVEEGLIYEEESTENKVGRKPTWLRINPAYGYFIGIEFHSKQVNCAMLDFNGMKLFEDFRPLHGEDSRDVIMDSIFDLIQAAIGFRGGNDQLLGIGLGVAGYFDSELGIGYQYAPLKNWSNVPVKQLIEDRFGCECYVENNVTSLAIGYKHLHMPVCTEDFLFASVRSGVRIVPYINNRFLFSNKGFAGQLGHTNLPGSNRMCLCGRRGCLNNEVSNPGIRSKMIEAVLSGHMARVYEMAGQDIRGVSVSLLIDAVLQGDEESLRLLNETAGYLGYSLGFLLDILVPRTLVVYGELCRTGDLLLNPLKRAIKQNAMADNTKHLNVLLCPPDESMGALGAASLVMQRQYEYLDEIV